MNPFEKEDCIRRFLERKLKLKLVKKRLIIGHRSDRSDIEHEFDIVSIKRNGEFDGKVLGEVKSDKFGNENGYRTTRFCRMITACLYLQKAKAQRKFLIFTDKEFYKRFKKDADGLISSKIKIMNIILGK